METQESQDTLIIKNSVGRPRKHEDPKQHSHDTMMQLKNDGYFKEYYKKRNVTIKCPVCSKETPEINLKQHQRSKKCIAMKKAENNKQFFIICKIISL
jgi:hypothetical protein